ncbi:universal stress protein [Streptomyces tagetis]|uniref:Universal stress protein n=1 Tax=Streptomyces tagetis TaxID=2820809 RepID=A0A940XLU6_9ACTN|nr:universal stress protein [Streptomyces sp. RG38]MBQ0827105.1 universal stress protein [Streptomyces sp. RG38]
MTRPLIVGVDGSESSLRATDWAADEAALRHVPLRIVHATLWERYEETVPETAPEAGPQEGPAGRTPGGAIVRTAAARARRRHPDLPVTTAVVPEEPEYALVREARDACAVVLGTRGRSGLTDLLLGSVGLAVAAHADRPVIVVRGAHDNRGGAGPLGRVVVGVGETSATAVRFACEEARLRDSDLVAVRAWRCPAHESADHPLLAGEPARLHEERAADALEAALKEAPPELEPLRHTVEGPAHRVLLAASYDADLLVLGARRRAGYIGLQGLQLGRVAHRLLHHSACPVAVVPEREEFGPLD